jgi:microcystin-dependent protein
MSQTTGEILLTAFDFAPRDYALCHGQLLPISSHSELFSLLGTTYGGDGRYTFALPDLRGRGPVSKDGNNGGEASRIGDRYGTTTATFDVQPPVHTHTGKIALGAPSGNQRNGAAAYLSAGPGGELFTPTTVGATTDNGSIRCDPAGVANLDPLTISNQEPSLALHYCICLNGDYPGRNGAEAVGILDDMTPYLGTVQFFANNFVPRGYAPCYGQLMSIAQNAALYNLLGTAFGGDGRTTFALPDLRGCYPLGTDPGSSSERSSRPFASFAGQPSYTMTADHLPAHTHSGSVALGSGRSVLPGGKGNYLDASVFQEIYRDQTQETVTAASGSVVLDSAGGGRPFSLQSPYLGLTAAIAVDGVYPPRP